MYVTRNLSYLRKFPEIILAAPEGPNSGYLVIKDEESETYSCFGKCKNTYLHHLPFPQNKYLTIDYQVNYNMEGSCDIVFIPVLDKPLSSNQYYAIPTYGDQIWNPLTSSSKKVCDSCKSIVKDPKAECFDPHSEHQQIRINGPSPFSAKFVAPGDSQPCFMTRTWRISGKTPKKYQLLEAPGIYFARRERRKILPDFGFQISSKVSQPIVVGKWYCPFMFIKDGTSRQLEKESLFYEMTLERKWERIFSFTNTNNERNSVFVDVDVVKEVVYLGGEGVVCDARDVSDGVMWFRNCGEEGVEVKVGLRVEVVDRMKWEQSKVGVVSSEENEVRVSKKEEFGEGIGWSEFGCYVLVESFVLKKMDGSTILTYDFRHTRKIKTKWE